MEKKTMLAMLLGAFAVVCLPQIVSAMAAPTANDFMYTLYDVGITKGLRGPLGYVIGTGFFVAGAVVGSKNVMMGIPFFLASAVALSADKLTESLGMII